MGANLMYSPLETVFESTMEREGKILTTYTGGSEFKAFFRIRNDNENKRDTVVIYYDVNAPVHPGTLVMCGYGIYVTLNRETVENDVYYKSTLLRCNGVYNENSGIVMNVPFYSDIMKSSVSVGNNVISILNGYIEFITEENSLSKQIEINQRFNEFGRTFRVSNQYCIDGILHIVAEVEANQEPTYIYSVVIDGKPTSSLQPEDRVQLNATTYMGSVITTGATLDWISSDNSIATVDGTGLVTCISEGTAIITCIWVEQNVSEKVSIMVASDPIPTTGYTYSITGNINLRNGFSRTYTLTITDGAGTDITSTQSGYEWNVEADFADQIIRNVTDNRIKLSVDNEDLIGRSFILQILVDSFVKAQLEIDIIDI